MKSCFAKFDRLTGVLELEVTDEVCVGDQVVCGLEKGDALGVVVTAPTETTKENLRKIVRKATREDLAADRRRHGR